MKMMSASAASHVLLTISAAVSPPSPYVIRSGSSCKNEKPRGAAIWYPLQPRSKSIASIGAMPSRSTIRARLRKLSFTRCATGRSGRRSRAYAERPRATAARSASMPTMVPPSPSAARRAVKCPPPPSVASTTVSLGCRASTFSTSSISTLS